MRKIFASVIFLGTVLLATSGMAAVIDFETVPSGLHGDDVQIYDQYSPWGVLFYIDNNKDFLQDSDNFPTFEAVGSSGSDTTHGFINDPLQPPKPDVESTGFTGQLGNFFMKAKESVSGTGPNNFIIEFTTPVTFASGQIWDIDGNNAQGTEKWHVTALNGGKSQLDKLTSPEYQNTADATSLNGQPWQWTFQGLNAPISYVLLEFNGTKESGVGLAIDNLQTRAVPLPAAVWLLGSGLLGLVGFRRFKK